MNWYDVLTLAIMAVVTTVQTIRGVRAGGMGLPLFEAAGVVVAVAATTALSHDLAGAIHAEESTVMFALFVAFVLVAFFVGRWLFALTGLSLQSLDGIFSFFCGLVMAWAVAHMFLRIMMTSEPGVAAEMIAGSSVAREVFWFRTWNALMRLLFNAQVGADFNPT